MPARSATPGPRGRVIDVEPALMVAGSTDRSSGRWRENEWAEHRVTEEEAESGTI
jgi:hypothetical protein